MNIKQKLSVLVVSFLLASCTTENVVDNPLPGGGDEATDANRREVLLTLKNKLSLKKAETKAEDPIATAEENYIRSLDVYVFGSETEDGPYTFQELFYYRDDATTIAGDGDWARSFSITAAAGKDNVSSGLLRLKKGLYVKLYCIANRTQLYETTAGGTEALYENFAALKQTFPGQPENVVTAGVPTEDDFKKLHCAVINPAAATENDVLVTPLPMTGSYVTPLDLTDFSVSSRTQLSFKLSRTVARFDVVNNAKESKFMIETISMGKGQPGSALFPVKPLVADKDKLITYPLRAISIDTQKEDASTTKGAFYTWPSPKEDEGFLILKGTYAVNQTESMPVSYQIPFQQIKDGVGSYIEVAYNHRYTIGITKADDYHLDFTLNVSDWDDQGAIDPYEPENDFDKDTKVTLLADAGANVGAYVLDNGKISVLPNTGSKFAFNISSNSELTEELIYKNGSAKWIVKDGDPVVSASSLTKAEGDPSEPNVPTVSTSKTTKYSFKVDDTALSDASLLLPVTIRVTNKASGEYKNIVVIPTTGPAISWTKAEGNYNTYDEENMIATLYNVANQTISLHVESETRTVGEETKTGCTATIASAATSWLSGSGELTGATADYELKLISAQNVSSTATVDFTSIASNVASQITVKLKDPAMTALTEPDFSVGADNQLDMTGGSSSSNPKVTMLGKVGNSFTVTVTSPEEVTAVATAGSDWFGVTTATTKSSDGKTQTKVTATISNADVAKSDGKITITNPLDGNTVVIDVVMTLPAGPTVSLGTNTGNLSSYDNGTTTVTLYNLSGQKIVLNTDAAASMSTGTSWLTASDSNATEHTITVGTAEGAGSSGTVTFTKADGGKTNITVTLKDPAITALASGDFSSVTGDTDNTFQDATTTGSNAKITMANAAQNNSCTLTVTSPEGITASDTNVSSWLTVSTGEKQSVSDGYTNLVTFTLKDAEAHTGSITLTNAIVGGGDLTVDVEATAPAAP